jgi:serine/threonine-protein kinase
LESTKQLPDETRESDFPAGAIGMSEQIRGGTIVHRSDLYSLGVGVLLYRLATWQEPLTAETLARLVARPSPPSQASLAYIQAWLDQLILRMLEKDPAARPQSAEEVTQCLDRRSIPAPDYRE